MDEAVRSDLGLIAQLIALPHGELGRVIAGLTPPQLREFHERWPIWAHDGQTSPAGEPHVWLILAGRGFGKTRAGAEWLSDQARRMPDGRFALVGATIDDARRVMIEGASGLIAVARTGEDVRWRAERGELEFPSGAKAFVYSAEAAEALRGPEHHAAWCDEIGKWGLRGGDAWDNLRLGLRLGDNPRVLVTTTPRPTALVRKVERLAGKHGLTRGRTVDNPHLPGSFVAAMLAEYGGTRKGRQELDGELLGDVEGALWTRAGLEGCRVAALPLSPALSPEGEREQKALSPSGERVGRGACPHFTRIVVGVDPPAGSVRGPEGHGGDACGIVVVGLDRDGVAHVLADASVRAASPEGWARAVARAAGMWGADRVVAEANNGGKMVASVLRAADVSLPLKLVHASHGKVARAEPVAALYEAGRVRHAGCFPQLEDEMCGLVLGGGYEGPGRSPDRADALVWALSELMLGKRQVAVGVRVLG